MKSPVVECLDVTKRFEAHAAVDGATLSVDSGQLLTLLGPSGCGKTTMLRLIAGFETPDAGSISVGGVTMAGPGVNVPPDKRRVGIVFQDYALFPHLDVESNVSYAMKRARRRSRTVDKLLDLVGLGGLNRRMPYELSGGEQQRVALARSLAAEPDVVLLDEPFSNLDPELRALIRTEVRQILLSEGATAIFVTHDLEEALSIADKVAVMFNGAVAQIAEPEELYAKPANRRIAEWLGDANFLPATGSGRQVSCELGTLEIGEALNGPVELMLRPEWLTITGDPDGSSRVVDRVFYGHDQMVLVRLASGTRLRVRTLSGERSEPGQHVTVTVKGRAVAYDLDGSAQDRNR